MAHYHCLIPGCPRPCPLSSFAFLHGGVPFPLHLCDLIVSMLLFNLSTTLSYLWISCYLLLNFLYHWVSSSYTERERNRTYVVIPFHKTLQSVDKGMHIWWNLPKDKWLDMKPSYTVFINSIAGDPATLNAAKLLASELWHPWYRKSRVCKSYLERYKCWGEHLFINKCLFICRKKEVSSFRIYNLLFQ